jgi:hypothetical protein
MQETRPAKYVVLVAAVLGAIVALQEVIYYMSHTHRPVRCLRLPDVNRLWSSDEADAALRRKSRVVGDHESTSLP